MKVKEQSRRNKPGRFDPDPENGKSTPVCPVCESRQSFVAFRLTDRLGAESAGYSLFRCKSCSLLFLEPGISAESIHGFYPDGYWWKEEGRFSSLEKAYREWILRWDHVRYLLHLFPDPKGLRLLDVGCGNGLFVKQARQRGFDAWGLESSPEAVAVARNEGLRTVICGSIEEPGDLEGKFDIVTLFHCLEHLPDPGRFLKRLKNFFRPPGHLILQVPNTASLQARLFGPGWYGLDCPRHLCNFEEKSLSLLLKRNGFRIEKVRHFSLRDNAAALASSLFPGLDPMAVKVRSLKESGRRNSWKGNLKEIFYLKLFFLAQPFAAMESWMRRGATLTVYAQLERQERAVKHGCKYGLSR